MRVIGPPDSNDRQVLLARVGRIRMPRCTVTAEDVQYSLHYTPPVLEICGSGVRLRRRSPVVVGGIVEPRLRHGVKTVQPGVSGRGGGRNIYDPCASTAGLQTARPNHPQRGTALQCSSPPSELHPIVRDIMYARSFGEH